MTNINSKWSLIRSLNYMYEFGDYTNLMYYLILWLDNYTLKVIALKYLML